MATDVTKLLDRIATWAPRHPEIVAVALLGSHARGAASEGSDVDILILTADLHSQLGDRAWLAEFGVVESVTLEQWGMVTSLRTKYEDGSEVEFGLAPARWAWVNPVDKGTRRVVRDGMRILYDPQRYLEGLQQAVE